MYRPFSFSSVPGALLLLSAVACGGGGDTSEPPPPPITPTELQVVSGDKQGMLRGDAALEPLRVRALGAEAQPVPGAMVLWTVTEGEGILEPTQSGTDDHGESQTRFTAGATIGDVLVRAAAEGTPPVTFTLTTLDPCQWTKRTQLMTPMTGLLGPLDCVDDGLFWDLYSFTLATQQAVTIQTSSNEFDTRSWLLTSSGITLLGRAGTIDSLETQRVAVTKAILAPGDYWAGVSSFRPGATGPYLLQVATTSPQAESCGEEVWVVRGINTDQQLTPTDCVDSSGRFYGDAFSLILWAGERVSFAQASSEFRPRLRLLRKSGDILAEVAGAAAGAAIIDFTADLTRGEYIVIASSAEAQQSGAYSLTVTETTAGQASAAQLSEAWSSGRSGEMLNRGKLVGRVRSWKR